MEMFLLNESLIWRKSRSKRVISFLRIIAYVMILESVVWGLLTFFLNKYQLTGALILLASCGFYSLKLIKQNKFLQSKLLILFSCAGYFLFVCIFASGYGLMKGSAHFGFILLSLVAYFMLSDIKFFREVFTLFLLFLFYCFHFGYAPFYPAMVLSPEKADMMQRFDVAAILISLFFIVRYFVLEIDKSEEALALSADKLEGLIGSMLPETVLKRIREEGKTFSDQFDDCSVLFADIVSFTSWSEKHSPYEIVAHLNAVFSKFDMAVEKRKLTKIKTIGDAYLVVSGVPEYCDDHAVVLTELALELQQIVAEYGEFEFRVGINSGPVVAGIIGKKTYQFDIWGDTVNVASRIESMGNPGKVNIGKATYEKIKHKFNCRYAGKFMAKNKGAIDLYEVE